MQSKGNKNLLSVSYFALFLFSFFVFSFIFDINKVFAQSCPSSVQEVPPCYESAPYPTSCNGIGATFCTGSSGMVVCKQQFKDTRNRQIVTSLPACTATYSPLLCSDAPLVQVPVGYIACTAGGNSCGDGNKEVGECCDGGGVNGVGSGCLAGCTCPSTSGNSASCGDGVCNGYETNASCPGDCPLSAGSICPSNPIGAYAQGPSNMVLYLGDTAALTFKVYSNSGTQYFDASVGNCLPGATCSGPYTGVEVTSSIHTVGNIAISNTASVPLGTYTIFVNVNSSSNPGCSYLLPYTVTVKPSRQSVCDAAWHEIPPAPVGVGISGPVRALYNSIDNRLEANALASYVDGACASLTGNAMTACRSSNWTTTVCMWDPPVNVVSNFPLNCGAPVYGWSQYGGSVGTTNTALDPFGRTYEFRQSGNVAEYKCAICPSTGNVVALGSSSIGTTGSTTASPPAGWSGGIFVSGNPGVATVAGSNVNAVSAGSTLITGTGWTASNGALNCNLSHIGITVADAVVDITANSLGTSISIPYNTAVDLRWSYSAASLCTITPPGSPSIYPSALGGPVSSGSLTTSKTYTISCDPGPAIDSVFVDVAAPLNYQLSLTKSGQGLVTGIPNDITQPNINCGSGCSNQNTIYIQDTIVAITALPSPGRVFTGWSGGTCTGLSVCNVVMNGPKSVIANFAVAPNFKEF